MNILIIAAIVFLAILSFVKLKEMRHRFWLIAFVVIVVFFLTTFGSVYFSNDLDLTTSDGAMHAFKVYFSWLGAAAGNMAKISTYAVKQDWGSNSTLVGK